MNIKIIDTGYFKLDGGAMFGVVPKRMWQNINPPDENNMCTWAMRCLLIQHNDQKILIDTGMGTKQDDRFRSHFEPHGEDDLVRSLHRSGIETNEITDVILTHLHFDHCGGAVVKNESDELALQFPEATYWSNKKHWDWAMEPNMREKASFLKENFVPIKNQSRLKHIDVSDNVSFNDKIDIHFVYGHTEAMMIPEIKLDNGNRLIYMADLLPSAGHIRLPYVMSYDIRPLITLEEREKYYDMFCDDKTIVMFEHDKDMAFGKIVKNDRGRYQIAPLNLEESKELLV